MTRDTAALERKARQLRRVVLDRIADAGRGHIGGIYSCLELLVALYYGGILKIDPRHPRDPGRDRFLMGKGHACLGAYAIFADLGFITPERFAEYGREGGSLGGQFDISIPGAEYNTGSLGHVLGIGAGIALASKLDGASYRAYAMLGDAECWEGSIWEAILFAGERRLDRLVAIVDRNRLSVTDALDDDGFFKDFPAKIRSFGWDCHHINGHDFGEMFQALEAAQRAVRPTMIIAETIKGKGISFMEHGIRWHHGVPNAQELALARKELDG